MLLTGLTICTAKEYEPLTDSEIDSYLKSITLVELRTDIRNLDSIENAVPIIPMPKYLAVLTNRDLYIYPDNETVEMMIGPLLYDITFPEIVIEDFTKPSLSSGVAFGLGCAAGILASVAVIIIKNSLAQPP